MPRIPGILSQAREGDACVSLRSETRDLITALRLLRAPPKFIDFYLTSVFETLSFCDTSGSFAVGTSSNFASLRLFQRFPVAELIGLQFFLELRACVSGNTLLNSLMPTREI